MLQRIQSLALLLASAGLFLGLKLPFYSGQKGNYALLTGTSNNLIMAMTIITGIMALISIFLFKNRRLQFLLCLAGIMLQGWIIYLYFKESGTYQSGTYSLTALIQPLIIIFFFIAARGVKKDMNTIRGSERLR